MFHFEKFGIAYLTQVFCPQLLQVHFVEHIIDKQRMDKT